MNDTGEQRPTLAKEPLLVAVDVDGTLLDTEFTDELREREIEAMRAVRAAGHILALCTGRNQRSLSGVLDPVGGDFVDLPRVLLNGAQVIGGRPARTLAHHVLPRPLLRRLVEIFRRHDAVAMVYDTEERGSLLHHEDRRPNGVLARYLRRRAETVGAVLAVDDLLAHLPPEALEVGTIDTAERVAALSEEILGELAGQVTVVNTETLLARDRYRWAEVYHPACSKGAGARLLASEYGISAARIVAVGDNYNDLDLFAAAAWSVAMGNAPESVREAADHVARPVTESGAARILEELAAGRLPAPLRAGAGMETERERRTGDDG